MKHNANTFKGKGVFLWQLYNINWNGKIVYLYHILQLSHSIKKGVSCLGILIVSMNYFDFLLFNSEFPALKCLLWKSCSCLFKLLQAHFPPNVFFFLPGNNGVKFISARMQRNLEILYAHLSIMHFSTFLGGSYFHKQLQWIQSNCKVEKKNLKATTDPPLPRAPIQTDTTITDQSLHVLWQIIRMQNWQVSEHKYCQWNYRPEGPFSLLASDANFSV